MVGYFPFQLEKIALSGCSISSVFHKVDIDIMIEKNIENAYLQNRETIVMGDFNINYFDHAYNSKQFALALYWFYPIRRR